MGAPRAYERRLSVGALALFGMVVYTMLVPLHAVSQTSASLLLIKAVASPPPCHGATASKQHDRSKPSPSKPRTHCPFCNGFAAFQLTLPAVAGVSVIGVHPQFSPFAPSDEPIVLGTGPAPQSRGPPYPSA